ncbi:hypothetical protein BDQ17DRAFT_1542075 [Cyathus striatus]|nr:hypothetical protein BDQ17DRAFT_1542075 [Cyathus striatus]
MCHQSEAMNKRNTIPMPVEANFADESQSSTEKQQPLQQSSLHPNSPARTESSIQAVILETPLNKNANRKTTNTKATSDEKLANQRFPIIEPSAPATNSPPTAVALAPVSMVPSLYYAFGDIGTSFPSESSRVLLSKPDHTQEPSPPMAIYAPTTTLERNTGDKGAVLVNGKFGPSIGDGNDNAARADISGHDKGALIFHRDISAGSYLPNLSLRDSSFTSSTQDSRRDISARNSRSDTSYKHNSSEKYNGYSPSGRDNKHGSSGRHKARNDNPSPFSFKGAGGRDDRTDSQIPSYARTTVYWVVHVYGQSRKVSRMHITYYKQNTLLGLLQNSLGPLTDQLPAAKIELIDDQAAKFAGAFYPGAQWHINVDNLPPHVGNIIGGVTTDSRKSDIGNRFMRFRFPHIFFEVSSISPLLPSNTTPGHKSSTAIWRAWAKGGANIGLVAYGKVYDEISVDWRIVRRHFEVIQVFQPEIFTPVPYPRDPLISARRNDFLVFSTSWTMIQFLRRSRSIMVFLVTLSALLAALQPVVSQFSRPTGWVLAGAGIMSGLVSITALFVSWILGYVESHAAQQRQYHPDKPFV